MVVSFKKTAECQYRRNDHHWSSLGHRRLRFSFQINDFKDQDRKNRTPLFSAGGRRRRRCSRLGSLCQELLLEEVLGAVPNPVGLGGGGVLVASDFRVNRSFSRTVLSVVTVSKVGGGGDVVASDFCVKSFF